MELWFGEQQGHTVFLPYQATVWISFLSVWDLPSPTPLGFSVADGLYAESSVRP